MTSYVPVTEGLELRWHSGTIHRLHLSLICVFPCLSSGDMLGRKKGGFFLCVICRVQYLSRSVACSYSRLSGGVIVFLSIFPTLRFFPFLLRSSLVLRLVEKRIGI